MLPSVGVLRRILRRILRTVLCKIRFKRNVFALITYNHEDGCFTVTLYGLLALLVVFWKTFSVRSTPGLGVGMGSIA